MLYAYRAAKHVQSRTIFPCKMNINKSELTYRNERRSDSIINPWLSHILSLNHWFFFLFSNFGIIKILINRKNKLIPYKFQYYPWFTPVKPETGSPQTSPIKDEINKNARYSSGFWRILQPSFPAFSVSITLLSYHIVEITVTPNVSSSLQWC